MSLSSREIIALQRILNRSPKKYPDSKPINIALRQRKKPLPRSNEEFDPFKIFENKSKKLFTESSE